jgi:hypothetical protein
MVVLKRKLAEYIQLKFTKVRSGKNYYFEFESGSSSPKMFQKRPDLESGSEPQQKPRYNVD